MKKIAILLLMIPFFSCELYSKLPVHFHQQQAQQQSKVVEGLKEAFTIGTQNSTNH